MSGQTGENQGGAQGGTGQGQQQTQQNQQQGGQQQGAQGQQQNKEKTGLDSFAELWKPKAAGGEGGGQGSGQGGQGNQQQGQQGQQGNQGGGDRLGDYLKGQNYMAGVDQTKFGEMMRNGDVPAMLEVFNEALRGMHKTILINADGIAKTHAERAQTNAVTAANSTYTASETYKELFIKEPKLELPAVAPVARSVLKNLLDKGTPKAEAIAKTIEYFNKLGEQFGTAPSNLGGGREYPGPGGASGSTQQLDYNSLYEDHTINFS